MTGGFFAWAKIIVDSTDLVIALLLEHVKKKLCNILFCLVEELGGEMCRNAVLSKDQHKLMGLCSGFEEETVKFH